MSYFTKNKKKLFFSFQKTINYLLNDWRTFLFSDIVTKAYYYYMIIIIICYLYLYGGCVLEKYDSRSPNLWAQPKFTKITEQFGSGPLARSHAFRWSAVSEKFGFPLTSSLTFTWTPNQCKYVFDLFLEISKKSNILGKKDRP